MYVDDMAEPGAGTPKFTRRQQEVLDLLGQGWSDKEIARTLEIGERMVRRHIAAARDRVRAKTRSQVVAIAAKQSAP